MNELQVFNHPEFGKVRTVEIDGKPWLIGKDVAEALGYTNPRDAMARHVDSKDKGVVKCDTLGGAQEMTVINESGLYALAMSSKLPGALKFKHWVTDEVLPSIRKNGGYIVNQETMTPEELIAQAVKLADKILAERDKRIANLTAQNRIMQPKAEYFDELVERNTLTNFRETAKELCVKEKDFINYLLDASYVYRNKKGKLQPYADKNDGLFEMKECYSDTTKWSGTQTLITPKGRATFRLLCRRMMEQ